MNEMIITPLPHIDNTIKRWPDLDSTINAAQSHIAGFRKADNLWNNIMVLFGNKDHYAPVLKDQTSVENQIRLDGKFVYMKEEAWQQISYLLNSVSAVLGNNKRKTINRKLNGELLSIFKKHCQSQTLLTSISRLFGEQQPVYLAQIFEESFAQCLFKNQKKKKEKEKETETETDEYKYKRNVPFIDLGKSIGSMIFHAARCQIFPEDSVAGEHVEFKTFINTLIFENYLNDDIIDITLGTARAHLLIDLFMSQLHDKHKDFRYLIFEEDLITFIKMCVLSRLIQENNKHLENLTKDKDNQHNHDNVGKAYRKIFERIYPDFDKPDNVAYFNGINRKLENKLDFYLLLLGQEMLSLLENKIIKVSSVTQKSDESHEVRRKPYSVKLIDGSYYTELPSELPTVYLMTQKLKETTIELPDGDTAVLTFKRKARSTVSGNAYISGHIKDKIVFDKNTVTNKFKINENFTKEFLESLMAYKTQFSEIKQVFLHLNSQIPKNINGVIQTMPPMWYPYENMLLDILAFVGEFYEINFVEFWKQANDKNHTNWKLQRIILDIVSYCLDFEKFAKLQIDYPKNQKLMKTYYAMYKKIKNQVSSKKIIFNELFYQISIMRNFKFYHYNWFADGRGRKQTVSLLSLQNMPLVRCFVSFYKPPTVAQEVDDIIRKHRKGNYSIILSQVHQEVKEIFEKKLTDYTPRILEKQEFSLLICCKTASPGKGFLSYNLHKDYFGLNSLEFEDYEFQHHMGFDSKNSGLQMLGIMLKSENLARFASMLEKQDMDAYVLGEKRLSEVIDSWIAFYLKMPISVTDLDITKHEEYLCNLEIPYAVYFGPKELSEIEIFKINFQKELNDLEKKHKKQRKPREKKITPEPSATQRAKSNLDAINKIDKFFVALKNPFLAKNLISRKIMKVLLMTTPYGSSMIGCTYQILDKISSIALKQGVWLTNDVFGRIKTLVPIIYKVFLHWFVRTMPEAMLLRYAATMFLREYYKPPIMHFETPYFTFFMNPMKTKSIRTTLNPGKRIRSKRLYLKAVLNDTDYKKLRSSLTANCTQFLDATIVSIYYENIYKHNSENPESPIYMTFTNHDCFYVPPTTMLHLTEDLRQCYKTIYELNLLDNFKQFPVMYNFIMDFMKTQKTLDLNQLCPNDDFVS